MFNVGIRTRHIDRLEQALTVALFFTLQSVAFASDAYRIDNDPPSAFATINSIDGSQRKIDVTHDPIPDINWPSMRMSLPVSATVDLEQLKPGARVYITLTRDQRGVWTADSVDVVGARDR